MSPPKQTLSFPERNANISAPVNSNSARQTLARPSQSCILTRKATGVVSLRLISALSSSSSPLAPNNFIALTDVDCSFCRLLVAHVAALNVSMHIAQGFNAQLHLLLSIPDISSQLRTASLFFFIPCNPSLAGELLCYYANIFICIFFFFLLWLFWTIIVCFRTERMRRTIVFVLYALPFRGTKTDYRNGK